MKKENGLASDSGSGQFGSRAQLRRRVGGAGIGGAGIGGVGVGGPAWGAIEGAIAPPVAPDRPPPIFDDS